MNSLFSDKRIFLISGPGGVGKTTLAASLGFYLSSQGYRTLVLTVDPAKRLAQALGFSHFSEELQSITVPGKPDAILKASMLDTEHTFDRLVDKFAKSSQQKKKILENRLYRTMVESLGGSHEYAAMERLLEFANQNDFDKIIVDTPPSQNALDLFKAPERMARFMDSSVFSWFQKKQTFSLFQKGAQLAMKFLQKLLGSEFLDQLASFLEDLQGMQTGFKKRHLAVLELLRSPATAFILVTQANEARFLESVEFHRLLLQEQITLNLICLNKMEPPLQMESSLPPSSESFLWMNRFISYLNEIRLIQLKWADAFRAGISVKMILLSKRPRLLSDPDQLIKMGEELTA